MNGLVHDPSMQAGELSDTVSQEANELLQLSKSSRNISVATGGNLLTQAVDSFLGVNSTDSTINSDLSLTEVFPPFLFLTRSHVSSFLTGSLLESSQSTFR